MTRLSFCSNMAESSYIERRMQKPVKRTLILLAAVIMISAVSAFAAAPTIPNIVATINGEKITKQELIDTTVAWDASTVLERLIMYKIVAQEAKKAGITVTDKDVQAKFAEFKKNLPPGQDFKEMLKRSGMTVDAAYAYMKMTLQAEGVVRKQIKVTPADLEGFNRASHILIRVATSADPKEQAKNDADAKTKIESIAAEIKAGMTFEDAAKKYSEDPMNKDKGGDLDYFAKGQMLPEFEKGLEGLKPGDISAPVKTSYGYHLIKFVGNGKDSKGADRKKLTDMVTEKQMGTKWQEFMLSARNKAKVVNFLDPAPKASATPKPVAPKPAPKPAGTVKPGATNAPPPPPPAPTN